MKKILLSVLLFSLLTGCAAPASEENTPIPIQMPLATPSEVPATTPPTPSPTEGAVLPVYPDPITGFFASCGFESGSGGILFGTYLSSMEAQAWKREAEHVFQILKENANPDIKEIGVDIDQIETSLYTFVEAQSELYAYICFTDTLGNEVGKWEDHITRGRLFSDGQMLAQADLYKTVVKDFYVDCLYYPKVYASDYVFDPDEVLAELESNNIACTVDSYEIEIPIFEWSELENPIDTWVKDNYLYCDDHLEADIWKAELEHLYSLLQAYSNPIAGLDPLIQRAKDAYFAFVPAFGEVESLYSHSSLFMPEYWEENIFDYSKYIGTIHYQTNYIEQKLNYREEVFRLREALCARMGEEKVDWAFDPAPYEAEIREIYGENWGKA